MGPNPYQASIWIECQAALNSVMSAFDIHPDLMSMSYRMFRCGSGHTVDMAPQAAVAGSQRSLRSTVGGIASLARPQLLFVFVSIPTATILGGACSGEAVIFGHTIGSFSPCKEPADIRTSGKLFGLLFFIFAILVFSLNIVTGTSFGRVAEKMVTKIRLLAFRSLFHQSLQWHTSDGRSPALLLPYLSSDACALAGLSGTTVGTIVSILVNLIAGIMTHIIAWKIAVVLLATLPILLGSGVMRLRVSAQLQERHQIAYATSVGITVEAEVAEKPWLLAPRDDLGISVTFNDVHFAYPNRPHLPILQGVNIEIPRGSFCALVGPSGAGKSTTISLLEKFYEPTSGSIEVGGRLLASADSTFRDRISLVPQESALFDEIIRFNLTIGARHGCTFTDEEIEKACRIANVRDTIADLPRGYDTRCGPNGDRFSGGQKQRLSIARALIHQPSLLLLDESTSALDADSEARFQDTLDKLRSGMTIVAIARRLHTIMRAQMILVIEVRDWVLFDDTSGSKQSTGSSQANRSYCQLYPISLGRDFGRIRAKVSNVLDLKVPRKGTAEVSVESLDLVKRKRAVHPTPHQQQAQPNG